MNKLLLFCGTLAAACTSVYANPLLTTGTPGDALLSTPTGPSLNFGTTINFDNLTPNSTLSANAFASSGVASISSPDVLQVLPYSTQSFPNYIYDASADGSANIKVQLSFATDEIGIGVADSDPVTVALQALDKNGAPLGAAFDVTIPEDTVNPGNGYYEIADTTRDIWGLQILQSAGDPSYSGLAVDDLQYDASPEPANLGLAAVGVCALMLTVIKRKEGTNN